jgi:hypothetical protein
MAAVKMQSKIQHISRKFEQLKKEIGGEVHVLSAHTYWLDRQEQKTQKKKNGMKVFAQSCVGRCFQYLRMNTRRTFFFSPFLVLQQLKCRENPNNITSLQRFNNCFFFFCIVNNATQK